LFKFLSKKQHCYIEEASVKNIYNSIQDGAVISQFYQECSPVFNAINLIVDSCVDIIIAVKDKVEDELKDHPILKILRNPNPFTDGKTFLQEFLKEYLITGNAYININKIGNTTELTILNDSDILINMSTKDNFPLSYQYNSSAISVVYNRTKDNMFISSDGNQIIHLRNTKLKQSDPKGMPPLLGAQLELSQYHKASVHNNAILINGCRPSKAYIYKGNNLTSEQSTRIQDAIKRNSGSQNSGRSIVLPSDIEIKDLSYNPQDLDFKNLKRDCDVAIQKCLKIPLALVIADNMTLSNLESSVPIFYDNAILPLLKKYADFLTQKLLPLYDFENRYEFIVDQSSIKPLMERTVENLMKLYNNGLITRNEARTEIGREASEGGDVFYQPQNLVPVGRDQYTVDNRQKFIDKMKQFKNAKGERLYSDDFIKENEKIYFSSSN
jgi:HK97 family phage portal protein